MPDTDGEAVDHIEEEDSVFEFDHDDNLFTPNASLHSSNTRTTSNHGSLPTRARRCSNNSNNDDLILNRSRTRTASSFPKVYIHHHSVHSVKRTKCWIFIISLMSRIQC